MAKKRPTSRRRWFADGLRFECQPDCGGCCVDHGDYSYVFLEGDDVERLAEHFEMRPAEFRRRYTEMDDDDLVLKMDGPRCPFLDGVRCTVYHARPVQCRTFPFWEENLQSRASWNRLRDFCPGIGKGEVHPLHVIQEHLTEREG